MFNTLLVVFTILSILLASCSCSKNILFIVTDDLGWSDLGFNDKIIQTPNINKLAVNGVILNQTYAYSVCTPSRNSFLTGIYAEHTGLNHDVIYAADPYGLPSNFKLFPQYLEPHGYKSHIVGKWHLGFCNEKFTPTFRGFDSFFGYFTGQEHSYTHRFDLYAQDNSKSNKSSSDGLDFWNQTDVKLLPVLDKNNTHSLDVFTHEVLKILDNRDTERPFFIYFAPQNVHVPYELPPHYEIMYSFVKNEKRRKLLGLITQLDDAIGLIVSKLATLGILDETIIAFTSDNGGPVYHSGNNSPLRGSKATVFEGGTRVRAFINAPDLVPFVNDGMFHAVDWLPTLLNAAIDNLNKLSDIDGINHWPQLLNQSDTKRNSFIYTIDPLWPVAAIREEDWKLITGCPGRWDSWYPMPYDQVEFNITTNTTGCDCEKGDCLFLFNLKDDPEERLNLAYVDTDTTNKMMLKLQKYFSTTVNPIAHKGSNADERGFPVHWGDKWSPGWC